MIWITLLSAMKDTQVFCVIPFITSFDVPSILHISRVFQLFRQPLTRNTRNDIFNAKTGTLYHQDRIL